MLFLGLLSALAMQYISIVSPEERMLRSSITSATSPRVLARAYSALNDYYLHHCLHAVRMHDNVIAVRLLCSWRLGIGTTAETRKQIVKIIQTETGTLPPQSFVERLDKHYGKSTTQLIKDVDYSVPIGVNIGQIHNGSITVSGKEIVNRSEIIQLNSMITDFIKYHDGKYHCLLWNVDNMQVVVYYYDHPSGHICCVACRDVAEGGIRWIKRLYGPGAITVGTGAAGKLRFDCIIAKNIICIFGYGKTGEASVEMYDVKTGERIVAYDTKNWRF